MTPVVGRSEWQRVTAFAAGATGFRPQTRSRLLALSVTSLPLGSRRTNDFTLLEKRAFGPKPVVIGDIRLTSSTFPAEICHQRNFLRIYVGLPVALGGEWKGNTRVGNRFVPGRTSGLVCKLF